MKKLWMTAMISLSLFGLTACGKGNMAGGTTPAETAPEVPAYRSDVAVADLKAAVAEEFGENYWPQMALAEADMEGLTGLTADSYEELVAEMPMISVNVDTLMIVKAKEGKAADVEKVLNDYRDRLVNDTMQYPMNIGKIQASKVAVYGNYVCFVQLGADTTEVSEQGEDAVIKYCQEVNDKALGIIEAKLTAE